MAYIYSHRFPEGREIWSRRFGVAMFTTFVPPYKGRDKTLLSPC